LWSGGIIIKTGAPMPDCLNPVRQILAAARFAAERHAAQRRKGRTAEPYVNHLLEVAELLARTAAGPLSPSAAARRRPACAAANFPPKAS